MDRRDLFKALVGAATAAGAVSVKAETIASLEGAAPALIVLEVDGAISQEMAKRLHYSLEKALDGTPFAHVRPLVLSDGMRLTMLDAHG